MPERALKCADAVGGGAADVRQNPRMPERALKCTPGKRMQGVVGESESPNARKGIEIDSLLREGLGVPDLSESPNARKGIEIQWLSIHAPAVRSVRIPECPKGH